MKATAKVRNDHGPKVVLDGGGRVTLSGGGKRRILYQNTCDRAQGWTTDHCQDQATPRLVVRDITLRAGNATGETADGGGGGAIFFVSDDRTGTATLAASTLRRNPSLGLETPGLPGIFFLGARRPALTEGTRLSR
jgi:hypothetical protein